MSDLGDCMDKIFPIATFTDYVIRLHLRRAERKQPEVRIWSEAEKFDLQMLNNGDYDYAQVTACLTQRHQKIFTEPYTRAMLHLTELEIVPVITTVKESIYLASFYWNVGGSHGSLAEYMTEALQLRPAYTETTVASLLGVMKLEADPLRELSAATLRWEAAQVERLRQWAARHAGPEHIASELFGNTDRLTVYKVQAMLSAVDRGVQPVHWTDEQPQLLVKLTRDEFPVERLVEKMDETYGRVFSIPMLIKEYARLQAAGVNIQSSPHLEALMYVE
ncbi:hypothetical protein MMC24_004153 [Lignoscripta atroalba]|nr:hypothetical protein [Lignoscripta atroalba]